MKDALIRLAAAMLALYFRHFPIERGKSFVWNRLVLRRLLWRRMELTATSRFGARFDVCFPDLVPTYLYFFGVWEPVITRYLLDRLNEGDIFIDVGANVGYYSLLASRRVGATGKVFSIEAASGTYAGLQKNLRQNGAANVTAFHVAVSDAPGRVQIWSNREGDSAGATTFSHVAERRRGMAVIETVEARPLEQILDAGIIRQARFIKIDVEGAEWAVVKSLGALLKTASPRTEIIIEINQRLVRLSGGTVEELLGYFAAAGFAPSVIANRYDIGFLRKKVPPVQLQPFEGWTSNQLDLVFRRTADHP